LLVGHLSTFLQFFSHPTHEVFPTIIVKQLQDFALVGGEGVGLLMVVQQFFEVC
jgi:hypothetical protein